jgi:hypothetical protein
MTKLHAFLIAVAVAFAVVAGAFAAFRTTQLGATSTARVSPAVLAAQTQALDRTETSLRHSLKNHPPALPKLSRVKPVPVPAVHAPAPRTVTVRVVRPAKTTTAAAKPTSAPKKLAGPKTPVRSSTTTVATTSTAPTVTTTTGTTRSHEHETETETETEDHHRRTSTDATTTTTATSHEGHEDDDGRGSDD